MYQVYILLSEKDRKLYIGFTEDISRRLDEHNGGKVESTRHRSPFQLIYCESYLNKKDALGREKFLKSGSGHRYLKKQLKNFFLDIDRGVEQSGSSSGSSWAAGLETNQ
ncbi:MAG: GIY-YIG nuclease family protein [Candidatus Omnitrophota bacterium]|nr:GIY-YIG nuclease family protein [Candidatus Omnitrophota bacterium]